MLGVRPDAHGAELRVDLAHALAEDVDRGHDRAEHGLVGVELGAVPSAQVGVMHVVVLDHVTASLPKRRRRRHGVPRGGAGATPRALASHVIPGSEAGVDRVVERAHPPSAKRGVVVAGGRARGKDIVESLELRIDADASVLGVDLEARAPRVDHVERRVDVGRGEHGVVAVNRLAPPAHEGEAHGGVLFVVGPCACACACACACVQLVVIVSLVGVEGLERRHQPLRQRLHPGHDSEPFLDLAREVLGELPRERGALRVHLRHLEAACGQSQRDLRAEEAAADHHRTRAGLGHAQHVELLEV
mmetsp:Transcript_61559/g.169191  ORF Transcript_61559/g.169191 Transcript_61559/m.169191 type:complete len:303 (-) Transcript_61559:718-1626(-)